MNQNANGALGPLPAVVTHNPPVLQDITNVAVYRQRALKRKLEEPTCLTENEIANIVVLEHNLVQRVSGDQVAPPWFAGAMQIALQPIIQRLDNLETRMTNIETRMTNIEDTMANSVRKQNNATAMNDNDIIVAPIHGAQNPPNAFPATIGELNALTGHAMIPIEGYYGLPADANMSVRERRRRIARAYGVIVGMTTVATPC